MPDSVSPRERARAFFDEIWRSGDHWAFETSPFEHDKYARQLALISDRDYRRALEIGCAAGVFTRHLAGVANRVVAVDVSPVAIARATESGVPANVEFRALDIMDADVPAEGPWDLIIISETIYYLGWLYPFFDVAWLAHQLFAATRAGGRLLMANTTGDTLGYLMRPWLIDTYRDLFVNVGYTLEHEEVFRGVKDEVPMQSLLSLFLKPADPA